MIFSRERIFPTVFLAFGAGEVRCVVGMSSECLRACEASTAFAKERGVLAIPGVKFEACSVSFCRTAFVALIRRIGFNVPVLVHVSALMFKTRGFVVEVLVTSRCRAGQPKVCGGFAVCLEGLGGAEALLALATRKGDGTHVAWGGR